ncbi:hypothetical protein E3Q22_01693 [Wallemia mellicola]|uniref:PH domain-containing protein n=1 Tax=Wallemia mellicola TaxID=1708541 RepID=A0A4V4MLI4_9BASI|nr:hypothetical protein E3Q22_01693 [Wallemia mellicola]TIB84755.1 hypothetical protein E3Q21_02259 [Wallemia mellicola]TIB87957.1 hypothetical protein E3Q20_02254 [Wallemia mellicola]TIB99602.1 hypothetical protein E3Q18_01501 [Wallemia mellicola]TIC18766.1 hypothetical protein E3Q13_01738 [Wallemia mellicola]
MNTNKKVKQARVYLNDLNSKPLLVEITKSYIGLDLIKYALSTRNLIIENPKNKINLIEFNNNCFRFIRNFENLFDQITNWYDDNNYFLVNSKKNYLKDSLSVSKSINVSIFHHKEVLFQLDSRKWVKRFLILENNNLFISKSDKHKDKQFLCNLLSYDVYSFKELYPNCPKPARILDDTLYGHLFLIKSQDNHSLFEKSEDIQHLFAANDSNESKEWIKAITQARTNAIINEKPWLFKNPIKNQDSSPEFKTKLTPTKSISRSNSQGKTMSRSNSLFKPRDNQQTLINLKDESIFTQGSLLARRESERAPSFLKHDPSLKASKSNVTRKRSGTLNLTHSSKSR